MEPINDYSTEKTDDIFVSLPRFVSSADLQYRNKIFLPSVNRKFERNGEQYRFTISPAHILQNKSRQGTDFFYPTDREQCVESFLRFLAVEDNPNFFADECVLVFELHSFVEMIREFDREVFHSVEEIELSLQILTKTHYELTNENADLDFHIIEELQRIENNQGTFYYLRFSQMFLGLNHIFIMCFGNK